MADKPQKLGSNAVPHSRVFLLCVGSSRQYWVDKNSKIPFLAEKDSQKIEYKYKLLHALGVEFRQPSSLYLIKLSRNINMKISV